MVNMQAITEDDFLRGRLQILQMSCGHRSGHEAVLLAASVNAKAGDKVCELGSGCGVAALCVAKRLAGVEIMGVDSDGEALELARENANRNQLAVSFTQADILAPFTQSDLRRDYYDYVIANPPFYEVGTGSRTPDKKQAHEMPAPALAVWVKYACTLAHAQGQVIFIHRAEALADILAVMAPRLGDIRILPILPAPNKKTHRVIVAGRGNSRAPLQLLPPLTLQNQDGQASPQAEAILREAQALAL